MPKRMGNGRIAGKRDRGPARKASTFNLFEWGDPLCDRPEVGRGGALLWSVAELRLVGFGFGGVPFGPPWGWTPNTTSVLVGGPGRMGGPCRNPRENFWGSGAHRPRSDVHEPSKG